MALLDGRGRPGRALPTTAGLTGTVTVRTPRSSQIPDAQKGSPRHVKPSVPGKLAVLIIHDDHEAENDAFYIMATGGDVGLEETRGATSRTTLDVVIEDDEDQRVRIRNSKFREALTAESPTNVYEPAGDPEITNPVFHIDAHPNRKDLPLEVRLDMVDLNDQTVSGGQDLAEQGRHDVERRHGRRQRQRDRAPAGLGR